MSPRTDRVYGGPDDRLKREMERSQIEARRLAKARRRRLMPEPSPENAVLVFALVYLAVLVAFLAVQ